MTWVRYETVRDRRSNLITIYTKGSINFYVDLSGDHEYAYLFYNKDTNQIGISFCEGQCVDSLKISKSTRNNRTISAKAFLVSNGVDFSNIRRFSPVFSEKDGLYVLHEVQNDKT